MSVTSKVDVPNHQPRDALQRLLEIVTGLLPFLFLGLIIVLSSYNLVAAATLLLIYTLAWLVRLFGYSYRLMVSFYFLKLASRIDWRLKLSDVVGQPSIATTHGYWQKRAETWYQALLASGSPKDERLDPSNIYQAVIMAVYNEPLNVIESSLKAITASEYDPTKI